MRLAPRSATRSTLINLALAFVLAVAIAAIVLASMVGK
jgi:hypothetical protein